MRPVVGASRRGLATKDVNKMRDYKKLDIWKISVELNRMVYDVTRSFPKDEIHGLIPQLRRASVSISSNIAEGCGRRTTKNFIHFLHNATGSLKEVGSQLVISKDLGYLSDDKFVELNNVVIKLGNKLLGFVRYVERVEDNRIYK